MGGNDKVFATLENLDIVYSGVGRPRYMQNCKNEEQSCIGGGLLVACLYDKEQEVLKAEQPFDKNWNVMEDKAIKEQKTETSSSRFEFSIEEVYTTHIEHTGISRTPRFYLMLKDNEKGEEECITSSPCRGEVELIMEKMASMASKFGDSPLIHTKIRKK